MYFDARNIKIQIASSRTSPNLLSTRGENQIAENVSSNNEKGDGRKRGTRRGTRTNAAADRIENIVIPDGVFL